MTPPDDAPPEPATDSEHRRADRTGLDDRRPTSEPTRRGVLRSGFLLGAGTGVGGLGVSSSGGALGAAAAQSSEEAPEPPTDLSVDWDAGGSVGLEWRWEDPRCTGDLAHFEVTAESEDEREQWTIAPTRYEATGVAIGGETTFSVRAVDEDGTASEPASLTYEPVPSDPAYVVAPEAPAEDLAPGERTTVPVNLHRLVGERERLTRVELDVELRSHCVAVIEDVAASDDLAFTVADAEWTSPWSVHVVAEGPAPDELHDRDVLEVTIAGREVGETVLDVEVENLVFLRDTYAYPDLLTLEDPDLDWNGDGDPTYEDVVVERPAFERWAILSVDGSAPVAPPENLRLDWQVSTTKGIAWDWPGELCSEELSHFRVVYHQGDHPVPTPDSTLEEERVPAARPAIVTDPSYDDGTVTVEEDPHFLVSVQAVAESGRRSERVTEFFYNDIGDPGHVLSPGDGPSTIVAGETATYPIELSAIMGREGDPVEHEIEISVSTPCVATIEDVTVPDRREILDLEWADDGSAVTVSARGTPEQDVFRPELATVEVAGQAPGEFVLDASAQSIDLLREDVDPEYYELVREHHDNDDTFDPEDDPSDLVEEIGPVTESWDLLAVGPPAIGDADPPRDLNGDGLYRDVDGSGDLTSKDLQLFFGNQHTDVVDAYPEAYDFDGDGTVGQPDVVDLFEQL